MGLFDSALSIVGMTPEEFLGGGSSSSTGWGKGENWSSSSGDSFGTSRNSLWGPQQGYMKNLWGQAQNLYQNQSPLTSRAQTMMADRAAGGSPLNFGAKQGLMDTLSGSYMPGGDKYQGMSGAIMRSVMPEIDSRFAGGRFGSGLHKEALGQAMQDKMLLNSNFERGNMMQAMGMAPGMAANDYMDIDRMYQAGQIPWQQMQNFQGMLGPAIMDSSSMNRAANRANSYGYNENQNQSQGNQLGGYLPGVGSLLG